MLYADLSARLLASQPESRASKLRRQMEGFYASAAQGNYSVNGVYIDSTQGFGAMFLLNYDRAAVAESRSTLLFDGTGCPAVLFAADEIGFLAALTVGLR